jgi:ribonuclease HI
VSAEKDADSFPLFGEPSEPIPPSEANVLRYLAQTMSVNKTLKRFPSLKPQDLQKILLRSTRRAEENQNQPPVLPNANDLPEFVIHADGACRGNPGEAGIGVILADSEGRTIKEMKSFIGMATNNAAEYRAVILGLEKALELGAGSVILYLDSELVVRQIHGEYRVRETTLKPLHQKALDLLQKFSRYVLHHVPREENRRADQLANEAIDQRVQKDIK